MIAVWYFARVTTTPRTRRAKAPATVTADAHDLPRIPARRHNPWVRRVLVFACCVLAMDALFGESGLAERVRARHAYLAATARLHQLRTDNAALREQARQLQEDPRAIEAVARGELGMVRPGEILVVVNHSTRSRRRDR